MKRKTVGFIDRVKKLDQEKRRHVFILAIVFFAAWSYINFQHIANVYPQNDAARANPITHFKYNPDDHNKGMLEATLSTGEVLEGEYRMYEIEASAEGHVYSLDDNHDKMTFSYRGLVDRTHGARKSREKQYRGVLLGNRGTRMVCEYFLTAFGHEGVGACRTSDGSFHKIFF